MLPGPDARRRFKRRQSVQVIEKTTQTTPSRRNPLVHAYHAAGHGHQRGQSATYLARAWAQGSSHIWSRPSR
jgi:hypothetical protein